MALLALMIVMHERMQRIRTRALVGAV
jgi:hypothetical protein